MYILNITMYRSFDKYTTTKPTILSDFLHILHIFNIDAYNI